MSVNSGKKYFGLASLFFGLTLLSGALWVLSHELRQYHYRDITQAIQSIPVTYVFLAAAITALNYILLTGYDTLAFRYVGKSLPYSEIGPVSFFAYSISNSFGFSLVSGTAVRYRFYSALDVSAGDLSKIVVFCSMTLWMGIAIIGGVSFLHSPPLPPGILHDRILMLRPWERFYWHFHLRIWPFAF